MDKSWMKKKRGEREYVEGVLNFVKFASLHARDGKILCPCKECANLNFVSPGVAQAHLWTNGMLGSYTHWKYHGESAAVPTAPECGSSHVQDSHEQYGDFRGMLHDLCPTHEMVDEPMGEGETAQQQAEGLNDGAKKFYKMIDDVDKPLYAGCTKFSIFSAIVVLFQLKTLCGWTNKSFTMLLQVLMDMLPSDAKLPKDHYEAKKIVRDLGLGYEKIHACPDDCMLFWKENANLEACPCCKKSRWKTNEPSVTNNNASSSKGKKKAAKILRWFPLKPRLQRLFLSADLASSMKWHVNGRTDDGAMRHPADSDAWKMFDSMHLQFSSEPRNVRLGLAADGFNPFGIMSSTHSTWPVMLVPYNLPPWLCMKRSSLILSLLIPGPTSPGIAIDVYLQPLVEELRELWDVGVEAFDASSKNVFQLRAALMWTIHDFPAYADVSGWSTKGKFACPCCASNTDSRYLQHGHKFCYMGHRRWLDSDHEFRGENTLFNGSTDMRVAPVAPVASDIIMDTESIVGRCLGKKCQLLYNKRKRGEAIPCGWKKRSILFTLPYWEDQKLRHNLDVMHIEKNVMDNILGTVLNLRDWTKDNYKARLDLADMGIRRELHLQQKGADKYTIPPTCFHMTPSEKDGFLQVLRDVRVPDGYASNISRRVNLKERKISGLKSHDNHILMQQLLPIALRGSLPSHVTRPLIKLACFFRKICSKTLTVSEIENDEVEIAVTLCELEKIFPPSFFTVMVHLVMHLATEAKVGGPVQYRWMYPIERYLSRLKSYVRNRAAPEGSIAEGYIVEECLTFCSRYMEGVETIFNRPRRAMEESTGAVSSVTLDNHEFTQAHRYVLFNSENIYQFREMHKRVVEDELRRGHRRISPAIIHKHHMEKFCGWFRSHVLDAGMGKRKRQLRLVYVGEGSSHGGQRVEAEDDGAHGGQRVEAEDDGAHGRQRVEAEDDEAHISQEARLVASDDDETQPPDDYEQRPAAENTPKRRGPTNLADIWALDGSWKIPLPLNGRGQPIGADGKIFVRWLGTFCHNGLLLPLVPAGWPKVEDKYKNDCWKEITQRYLIDEDIIKPPDQKAWAMHILGVLRRNRRSKLKKIHVRGRTKEEVLRRKIPRRVMPEQWVEMVNYWFDQKTVTLSNKNKVSRGKQKEIARSGAASFAQISHDMAKDNEVPVERADVYLKVYRRRDGTGVTPRAQENITRMEELLSREGVRLEGEPGSGILWSPNDAYAQVFGRERHGRVRGVGLGITPSGRSATNASQFTSTPSVPTRTTQRILELESNSTRLTEQLAQLQEKLAQSEARQQESEARQRQMAEVIMRMNEMFAQHNGSSIADLSMSQGGGA